MEAVTALAVAGNILQFLDFSYKLLSKSLEIHQSQDGLSKDRRIRERILKDSILTFSSIESNEGGSTLAQQVETNVTVVDGAIKSLVAHSTILAHDATKTFDESYSQIRNYAAECSGVARQLLQRIEKLKTNGKKKTWSSLKAALAETWARSDIEELQRSLELYKSQLEFQVLISLRENVNLIASRQADQFSGLESSMKMTIKQLLEDTLIHDHQATSTISISPSDLEVLDKQHRRTRAEIKIAIQEALRLRNLEDSQSSSAGEGSTLTQAADQMAIQLLNVEKAILNSLKFSVMLEREDEISTAERATFDWIFEEQDPDDSRWSNFSTWLLHGDSVYWLTGKAGSGKSTLMKHIFCHDRTRSLLRQWTNSTPLVVAGFFFWNSGAPMQKTQEGLLRSLLFQVLAHHRELLPVVLPDLRDYSADKLHDIWTLSRLTKAFKSLVRQDVVPLRICFFVDGLDEYSGDHAGLADLLKHASLAENVKVCAASRPLVVFEDAFKGFESLMLQRLTFDDISTYVLNQWSSSPRMVELNDREPDLAKRLGDEIVNKAAGVFLWVKLVVRSLLEGLTSYDRGSDLERRLEELPEDLENLYLHMLKSIRPAFYFEQATKLLQITYHAKKPLTILQLAYADMEKPQAALDTKLKSISDAEQQHMCTEMEGRLKSRCLGLLEVSLESAKAVDARDRPVRFMHQSVADFLEKGDISSRMMASLSDDFNPFVALMRSTILDLKHLDTKFFPGQQPAVLIAQMWFRFALAIIQKFAYYAAKSEEQLKKPHVDLIDEIDRVASKLYQVYMAAECRFDLSTEAALQPHWSERRKVGSKLTSIQLNGSLFSWACENGLFYFLQARLVNSKPTSAQAKFALLIDQICNNSFTSDASVHTEVRDSLMRIRVSSSFKIGKFKSGWGLKKATGQFIVSSENSLIKETRAYDKFDDDFESSASAVAFNTLLSGTAFSS